MEELFVVCFAFGHWLGEDCFGADVVFHCCFVFVCLYSMSVQSMAAPVDVSALVMVPPAMVRARRKVEDG